MSVQTKIVDPLYKVTDDFLNNPYKYYANLRENAPVFWSEKGHYWIVSKYDDVEACLKDLRFGKHVEDWKDAPFIRRLMYKFSQPQSTMLNRNPPDHTRLRGLVNKAFTPKMVEQLYPHIQQIAGNLIDKVVDKGSMDIVSEFAFPLPVIVIAEMLGVPPEDREVFKGWSHTLTAILEPTTDWAKVIRALNAKQKLTNFLIPLIEERRKNPQNDLISSLVQAEEAGNSLSKDELLANIILVLIAGHETTVNLISNSVMALLTHPDQLEKLKNEPTLMANAVEEFLRYQSPVQLVRRITTEDIEFKGHQLEKGQLVYLLTGSANHDPEHFPNPEQLDITRANIKHLAYGFGIHHCLGSSLASAEGRLALTALFHRLPNMKLAIKPEEIRWKRPFSLRGPVTLPITF